MKQGRALWFFISKYCFMMYSILKPQTSINDCENAHALSTFHLAKVLEGRQCSYSTEFFIQVITLLHNNLLR